MAEMAEQLYVADRDEWREWLKENHESKKEVWLVYYKKRTGKASVPYDDSVEEALCFGWVDSIVKKLDEETFARKFTPRKGESRWSGANKKRVLEMIEQGKMAEAGLKRIKDAKASGEWSKVREAPKGLVIPSCLKEALAMDEKASHYFDKLAYSYKRQAVAWIASAKKEETRERRVAEVIRLFEQNRKLGLK
jgi:uncharacterized protein YdeI (YjbR/CyaY-like superfamily)